MKLNHLLSILFLSISLTLNSQSANDVLMTVGNADVTVEEFRYIYEKNNGDDADYSKESLDEYLDLYKNFKLKVQKAKEMKLDTIQSLKDELDGYRKQLASSFLSDKEILGIVVDEVHSRKQQDVELEHILLRVKPTASEEKKMEAEKKIADLKKQIANGKSIGELAGKNSEDKNSSRRRGYLGFTTAMLPDGFYELENSLYNSKIGDIIGPVWSKMGCHLLSVKSRRPARGVVKVSHILIKAQAEKTANEEKASIKADSIYNALNNSLNWNDAISQFSEDNKTVGKKGELPIFGIGTYELAFEDAAFSLKKPGEFSKPVKTKSGYHIIKLIEKVPFETKGEIKKRLKDKIKKYDRYTAAEEQLISRIKKRSGFDENSILLNEYTESLTPSFYSYKWNPGKAKMGTLFSIENKNVSLQEFADYCKKNSRKRRQFDNDKPLKESIQVLYKDFVRETVIEIEEKTLENKYPAFRSLMREYQEGILLFEATKMSVWDKANQDSIGLQKFYNANKSNYIFDERALVGTYAIQSTNEKEIKKIMKCAKKNSPEQTLNRFNKGDKDVISYTESLMDITSAKFTAGLVAKQNAISEPNYDRKSGVTIFEKVISIEEPRIKKLTEARGYVVADYQDELEQNWLQKLRKEFPIEVNNRIYKALIK